MSSTTLCPAPCSSHSSAIFLADDAIGGSPALSDIDRHVLNLWSERAELKAIADREGTDAAAQAVGDVETKLDKHIGASIQALGGVLVMEIDDEREGAEDIPGLYHATLAAIRPQLVGVIAEAADRALGDAEPDPTLAIVAKLNAAWDRLGEALKETTHFEDHPLVNKAHSEIDVALAELQATPPTNLAGARAAIARLVEYDKENIPEVSGEYLRTLSRPPIFAQEEARA